MRSNVQRVHIRKRASGSARPFATQLPSFPTRTTEAANCQSATDPIADIVRCVNLPQRGLLHA